MNKHAKEIRDMSEEEFEQFCKQNMNECMHQEQIPEDFIPKVIAEKVTERLKQNETCEPEDQQEPSIFNSITTNPFCTNLSNLGNYSVATQFVEFPYSNTTVSINSKEQLDKVEEPAETYKVVKEKPNAYTLLQEAAETYKSRNEIYHDAYKRTGPVLEKLFPNGLNVISASDFNRLTIFITMVSKMVRYSTDFSKGHNDSMLDIGAYSAMLRELDSDR